MTYVKKLVIQGFKSFARKTEIPFEDSMNVIVGPNGSGKSNVTDALCFVLGRLSIKSIRAAKAANLLFRGNQTFKGSNEASVELVLDNSKKTFSVEGQEVKIKRTVRKNGQSIYQINGKTKTRQDLLELLSQGGIDPNGFNIILQGEIASMIKMSSEDRRKIIEEVAGISIYETRKYKSLKELEKSDEKIKEVNAVLKERNSFLKNLEKERKEALDYQKLEETIKKCKATIIDRSMKEKEKEVWEINKIIENNSKEIEKYKQKIGEKNIGIEELQEKISNLNKRIQESTGRELEELHRTIANLKGEIAELRVRRENYEEKITDLKEKTIKANDKMKVLEKEIEEIQTQSPEIKKQQEEQKRAQQRLDELEVKIRKFYSLRSKVDTSNNKREEKQKQIKDCEEEIRTLKITIESLEKEISLAKSIEEAEKIKTESKNKIFALNEEIKRTEEKILTNEKRKAVLENQIGQEDKLKEEINDLDKCPVCRQEVSSEYKENINSNSNDKIEKAKEEIDKIILENEELKQKIGFSRRDLLVDEEKVRKLELEIMKLETINDKEEQINKIKEKRQLIEKELDEMGREIKEIKEEFNSLKDVEEDYDSAKMKLQEFNFSNIDVDSEVSMKKREYSKLDIDRKAAIREIEEAEKELKRIEIVWKERNNILDKKEDEERNLYEKNEKFFEERNELSDQQKVLETDIIGFRHDIQIHEEKLNNGRIEKAQLNAQLESLKEELKEYEGISLYSEKLSEIKERLQKSSFRISQIGQINMRAIETFEKIKEQVKLISDKIEVLNLEKEKISKIIDEIDKKKKKVFIQTLDAINEYFTRNFSQLSKKGEVKLELENKKSPFEGGLEIIFKVGRGKYYDITSLSGGEKTMASLALIFAIQEYKPYCFYIFDEIDAALDKHNSELLAALIKKYMKTGQYIVITHNDTLITEASALYGVSMQDSISKIVSLKV